MPKPSPNPPESEIDPHLKPAILKSSASHNPSSMFLIASGIDTETLLAHACESLASASVMATISQHSSTALSAACCWASSR